MQFKSFLASAFAIAFLASCGNNSHKEGSEESTENEMNHEATHEEAQPETCKYTYVDDSTAVTWTAYKYESKAGVGGSFKQHEVYPMVQSGDYSEVLNGMEFRIPVASTYTNNDDRDAKIKEHFWGKLANTDMITGEIVEVSGTEAEGKVKVKLTMNNMEQTIDGTYTMKEDGHISLMTEVDMSNFGGLDAIAALNKVCEDLHREAPGQKSVLWPNVSVVVKGFLKKDCPENAM
ncbi:hypothetical protein GC194_08695 [bacterium]|nr:hypothetical protein [bacterium]